MREITFDDLRVGMLVEIEYEDGSMIRGKCIRKGETWAHLRVADNVWSIHFQESRTIRLLEEPMLPPEPPVGTVGRAGSDVFVSGANGWYTPLSMHEFTWKEIQSYGPFVELVPKEEK